MVNSKGVDANCRHAQGFAEWIRSTHGGLSLHMSGRLMYSPAPVSPAQLSNA